jgi:tagaturonate reductase
MTGRIIQFGTSRFLQAHADLFVHQARLAGQEVGPVTVIKTTGGADRAGRVAAFKRGLPFPVRVCGLDGSRVIDETIDVASVDSAFDAECEWADVVRVFAQEAEVVFSNVGERGYDLSEADAGLDLRPRSPPKSFPMKLLALLIARFEAGGHPLLVLPTELVRGNGGILSGIISELACKTGAPASFREWLSMSVVFADTLVDRIVSAPIEPIGAVAEPYALWTIRRGRFKAPFDHPSVQVVEDLEPYERLKLHMLNLGHTVLADLWLKGGRPADETVREILDDPDVATRLRAIYEREVMPGFALHGMGDEGSRYLATTMERFKNPFLHHRLAEIAQNHAAKLKIRIGSFLEWARERDPSFEAPGLSSVLCDLRELRFGPALRQWRS